MRLKRLGLSTIALILMVPACGPSSDGGAGPEPISHPNRSDELVLRMEQRGGLVPYESSIASLPSWSLFGDGTTIGPGPQIEIYPGPALPNLLAVPVTEQGMQTILRAARRAGLLSGDATYPAPCVADAPTTVFTTTADGATSVVSAEALEAGPSTGCGKQDRRTRLALVEFQMMLGDLHSWLPAGSIGDERPYEPAEVRVHVLPYRPEPDLPQAPITWPLDVPLDAFGESASNADGRCGVVAGPDLETLLEAARSANQLTPWTSAGDRYRLILRPLLPDEHAC